MPITNKKFLIAIEALAYIAVNSGEKPVSSKDICQEFGLKLRYTEQIMQKMVKAGILKSMRGAAGGYSLARERRKITLNDIYKIVKNLSKSSGIDEQESAFSVLIDQVNEQIESELEAVFGAITMEDIYNKAIKIKDLYSKNIKTDFSI